MRLLKTTSLITLIISLSSCMSSMDFKVLEPAPYPLSSNIRFLVVTTDLKDTSLTRKRKMLDRLVHHISGSMSSTNRYVIVNADTTIPILNENVNKDENLERLLYEHSADAVLHIKNPGIRSNQSESFGYETYEDANGQLVSVGTSSFDIMGSAWARYMVLMPDSIDPIDKYNSDDMEQITRRDYTTRRELQQFEDYLIYRVAAKYVDRINPKWKDVSRNYYSVGHPTLTDASIFIKYGRTDEAIVLWKKLFKHKNKKIRGKAHYNMAVASEYKGSIPLAMDYLAKAKKYGVPTNYYYKVLQIRKGVVERLNTQYGR